MTSTQDFSYFILSFNTSSVWLLFIIAFTAFIFRATLTHAILISKSSWQTVLEATYSLTLGMVNENAGPKLVRYFPLIFVTFVTTLCCNLLGMIPYSFTVTSHLIVTFCAALAAFVGLNIVGVMKNRSHFLSLFFPPGAPMALAPLLVFIEFVSYIFRVLSLSIRLFANLMSGHTLLKILSGFAWVAVSF
jgi:ATP synthase subunit 6